MSPPEISTQSTDLIYDDSMLECLHSSSGHRDLRKLKLESVMIERNGSTALLTLLRMKDSKLLEHDLMFSIITDGIVAELASGLAENVTLKQICLRGIRSIANVGWHAVFAVLKRPSCTIEDLDLYHTNMNDATALSLTNATSDGCKRKLIDLGKNPGVTVAGWRAISTTPQSPNCTLKRRSLKGNRFDCSILRSFTCAARA